MSTPTLDEAGLVQAKAERGRELKRLKRKLEDVSNAAAKAAADETLASAEWFAAALGKYQNDLTKIRIEIARLDGLIDWLE